MTALAGAIDQAPVEPTEKARLTSALKAPPTVEHIAGLANGPEEASEIYGAALTAIDLDSPSEHLFLRRLASSLKLDEQLVKTVHETLEKNDLLPGRNHPTAGAGKAAKIPPPVGRREGSKAAAFTTPDQPAGIGT
jgi:hypothetical protein